MCSLSKTLALHLSSFSQNPLHSPSLQGILYYFTFVSLLPASLSEQPLSCLQTWMCKHHPHWPEWLLLSSQQQGGWNFPPTLTSLTRKTGTVAYQTQIRFWPHSPHLEDGQGVKKEDRELLLLLWLWAITPSAALSRRFIIHKLEIRYGNVEEIT